MNIPFDNATMRAHYLELADAWETRAAEERGKTAEMGWHHWERIAAESRLARCEAKRDQCIAKADTYR